jgi:hypothetical protein
MVGKTLEVVLGIADDKLLVAVGRDAAKTLKRALDQSKAAAGKEVPPLQISFAYTPIFKFAAQSGDDEQAKAVLRTLAEALQKAGGKDHLTLTAQPILQGFRLRLEVEEELLKALASMGQMMVPMGAMPVPR